MKERKMNGLTKVIALVMLMFTIMIVSPTVVAQTPNFDVSQVNGVLSSKSNDVKTIMLWIAYISILLGLGMLAANYLMQVQSAKMGLISFGVGVIIYLILKAL